MKKVFKRYADYYDSLYQDKDYLKECNYIDKIINKFSRRKIRTILDLGCGTGSHDIILQKKGYQLTGVDLSQNMLRISKKKAIQADLKINFIKGDIRSVNLKTKYDAVISLFAVMGYQITNSNFEKALLTVNKHLINNGLFIFDIWFGPAVLADKPKDKTKKVKFNHDLLLRKTKVRFDLFGQKVEIKFKTQHLVNKLVKAEDNETHQMRFFFPQEIQYFLSKTGFQLLAIFPFLTFKKKVTEKDWNIMVIAKKNLKVK